MCATQMANEANGALRILALRSIRQFREAAMTAGLDERRRRAFYRATHRGTKEMDWLLGRYAHARLADMSDAALGEFEVILGMPDPQLQSWLMGGERFDDSDKAPLLRLIRAFHGLENAEAAQ